MKIARFKSGGEVMFGELFDDAKGGGKARRIEGDFLGGVLTYTSGSGSEIVTIDRLLAPIVPTDILCIGLNYRQHAAETNSAIPQNPMLFIKSSNTLNDPHGDIVIPRNSTMVDFEAELGVIIGKTAKHVSRENAMDYVFGYTCANDISARDWQKDKALGGGQFARGKSFDTFCPLGPWIVTKDEIADPNKLAIQCTVNDQIMQDASTADMIYDVPALIASLSSTLTLRPGSIILTGTPHGVGMGRTPPLWLKAGDRVTVKVQSIGTLQNTCVAE